MRTDGTRITRLVALAVPLLLYALASDAQQRATLGTVGRLREQANKDARLLANVPEGTAVSVFDEERGWRRVELPDGTRGWLWADHLRFVPAATAEATVPSTLPASASASDDVRALRAEVEGLRQRPPGATAADVEQLRAELRALAAAQRDLERRLRTPGDEPREPLPVPPPVDGGLGIAAVLVLAGGAVGWVGSRIASRRRERRQRIRI